MRIRWYNTVRWKLTIVLFIIMFITLFGLSFFLLEALNNYFFKQNGIDLMTKANIIAGITSYHLDYPEEHLQKEVKNLNMDSDIRVIIVNKESSVIYDSVELNNLIGKTFIREEVVSALEGNDTYRHYEDSESGWVINSGVPVLQNGEIVGVVYLTKSAQDVITTIEDIKKNLYAINIGVSLFIGIISLIFAGIFTRRVSKLTEAINTMFKGDLNQKVHVHGKDEIAQLGNSFNELSDMLYINEEKRKKFVSDASHELKTPLSSIKVLSQSLLDMNTFNEKLTMEFLKDINTEVDRLDKITGKLLILTKLDDVTTGLEYENVNIKELLDDIIKNIKPISKNKNIFLSTSLKDNIIINADRDKIWEALYNVIDNAIKYSPYNGEVDITMQGTENKVNIIVSDNGIGIPENEKEKIFERFYRVDKARSRDTGGTGLGLAIALNAVKLFNGSIKIESQEGKGSKFIISFPIK